MAKRSQSSDDPKWDPTQLASEFAKSLQDTYEIFNPLREAVVGYKAQYVAEGFSEGAAEAMAVQYHSIIIMKFAPGSQDG